MRERMGLDSQQKKDDAGYGGYKKGHGVSDDWMNKNNAWQSEQRERKEEEGDINEMWKPTKSQQPSKYDDYSKKDDIIPKQQPK